MVVNTKGSEEEPGIIQSIQGARAHPECPATELLGEIWPKISHLWNAAKTMAGERTVTQKGS